MPPKKQVPPSTVAPGGQTRDPSVRTPFDRAQAGSVRRKLDYPGAAGAVGFGSRRSTVSLTDMGAGAAKEDGLPPTPERPRGSVVPKPSEPGLRPHEGHHSSQPVAPSPPRSLGRGSHSGPAALESTTPAIEETDTDDESQSSGEEGASPTASPPSGSRGAVGLAASPPASAILTPPGGSRGAFSQVASPPVPAVSSPLPSPAQQAWERAVNKVTSLVHGQSTIDTRRLRAIDGAWQVLYPALNNNPQLGYEGRLAHLRNALTRPSPLSLAITGWSGWYAACFMQCDPPDDLVTFQRAVGIGEERERLLGGEP